MVKNENRTNVEMNTWHVYAKTEGFRLFNRHEEGSGSPGTLGGVSCIGLVGEICIGIFILAMVITALMWWQKVKLRHDSYQNYYRTQAVNMEFVAKEQAPTGLPQTAKRHRD